MKKTTIRLNKSTVFIAGTLHHLPENSALNFGNVKALKARKTANREKNSLRGPAPKKSPELSKVPAKMPENPFHPFSALAEIVAQRLENPVNRRFLNGEIKRARGSNGKKSILKNDGKLHGHAIRMISKFDREEIRGEISLALAEKPVGEKLTFENWKTIFSESRKTLRINRQLERENLLSSFEELQETNFHSDLTASAALLEFREREKSDFQSTNDFCDEIFCGEIREFISLILAAYRDDKSRQAKSNKRNALKYLKKAAKSFRGFGHGEKAKKIHHRSNDTSELRHQEKQFLAYIATGKNRMVLEKAAYDKAVMESAQLALDGRLFAEHTEDIDLAGLLSVAMKNFNPRASTLDETDMENQWNTGLKQRLASSEKQFRECHPPITGATVDGARIAATNAVPLTALTLAIQKYKARSMTSRHHLALNLGPTAIKAFHQF